MTGEGVNDLSVGPTRSVRERAKFVLGLLILALGPVGLIVMASQSGKLEEASEQSPFIVAWVVLIGIMMMVLLWVTVREIRKPSQRVAWLDAAIVLLLGVGACAYFTWGLGLVVVALASSGYTVVNSPQQGGVSEGDVFEFLVWSGADTVPALSIPKSLGWEAPVNDPALALGASALTIRCLLVFVVFAALRALWQAVRRRESPSQVRNSSNSQLASDD